MRFSYYFLLFTLILTTAISSRDVQAVKQNSPITSVWYQGIWEGWTIQTDPDSQYTTIVSLIEGQNGTIVGTTAYPELRCGGTLSLISHSPTMLSLREKITYGNCVDNGIIEFTLQGGSTGFYWYSDAHPAIATSTLTQISSDSNILPQQYVGVWEGRGVQQNPSTNWSILLTLTEGDMNDTVGTIAYPSLRCGGKLTLLSINTTELTFRETITYGNCVDQGLVTLAVSDAINDMLYEWELGTTTATGSLERINGESYTVFLPLTIRER